MSSDAIYDAFATLAGEFAVGQGVPVSFPAVGFTPPDDGAWLELQWFPNDTQNYGRANDAPSLVQGFAQVSACTRPGAGLAPANRLADAIIDAFGKGVEFGGVRVYRKPWARSVIIDPDRVMVPVTIMWRGFQT
ncbi:phage tail terminator-like protein [Coralloluteibacterium thermophilus]|uniref:Phage tail terminator-like protein n=1 Tax=Coralloluteibacterium thermophilum TaxID=2707049 RepID=A0ABV9NRF3_9GAMM